MFLSRHQCDFWKDYSAQQCLFAKLEKWKSAVDNKKTFGKLLTDLSKAFDCFSHDRSSSCKVACLWIQDSWAKICVQWFDRKQRTKINSAYSSSEESLFRVPQRSILGPLLFNIFLCDLFYVMSDTDFASYADNNISYVSVDTINGVFKRLGTASVNLFKWFVDNQMEVK